MPSLAAMGTCGPRRGTASCGLPGDVERAPRPAAAAGKSAPDCRRVPNSFTDVNSIGYEDHGFAERFGGYQFVEAEVRSAGGSLPVNPSGGLKAEGGAPSAVDVAQCPELFTQRRVVVNLLDAARIAMAHNIGGLTALSACTILEGPAANGS